MPLRYYKGDIFTAPAEILIHQANCFCKMKSGIAKAITDRFREVALIDGNTKAGDKDKLGMVGPVHLFESKGTNFKFVLNCYSQYNWGRDSRKTNYEAYYTCLEKVRSYAEGKKMNVAAPYKMGCSLAGGNWEICLEMFEEIFKDSSITCYICKHPDEGISEKVAPQN